MTRWDMEWHGATGLGARGKWQVGGRDTIRVATSPWYWAHTVQNSRNKTGDNWVGHDVGMGSVTQVMITFWLGSRFDLLVKVDQPLDALLWCQPKRNI